MLRLLRSCGIISLAKGQNASFSYYPKKTHNLIFIGDFHAFQLVSHIRSTILSFHQTTVDRES